MNIEQLREFCLSLPGVTEDMKWGDHLCFCVAEKIFLIVGLDENPLKASFKVPTEQFDELIAIDYFKQAPYLAKRQWVHISDINKLNVEKWEHYAYQSYEIIKSKLPKKTQKELENLVV
ncbi:MAG: MmcQ/YjbR family DNA-binding protein [Bacteroidia bacterium]|nr:MmcQ/YjbR family DNA-binding protein [Bacteroidia bacterium]